MKTTHRTSTQKNPDTDAEMLPEYSFNYSQGVRGKYSGKIAHGKESVMIDKDIVQYFQSHEALNMALRHIMAAVPKQQ